MDKQELDALHEPIKQALAEVWNKDSRSTWPIDLNAVSHLFLDIFAAELREDLERLKTAGKTDREIAEKFKTPGRITRLIMPIVMGMRAGRRATEEVQEQVKYLLTLARQLKYGDLANRGGKNIVLDPRAQERLREESPMAAADRASSLRVHKLSALLWNYAECLGFRAHGFNREFHGPYPAPREGEEILIRDFIDIRPTGVWEAARAVENEKIRVIGVYRGLGMSIDIYNNVAIQEGTTYVNGLNAYRIEADGKELSIEEVERMCDVLSEVMLAITGEVEAMEWRQRAWKYAEIFWNSKKELREPLEWGPPGKVRERIEAGEMSTRLRELNPQALQRMLRISF